MNKRILAGILCAGMILTMSGFSLAVEDNQNTTEQTQEENKASENEEKANEGNNEEKQEEKTQQSTYVKPQRYEVLVLGDSDQSGETYIKGLQTWLIKYGHLQGEPTGYYGEQTQKAVLEFQTLHQMSVDGKAGPITRKILMGPEYTPITENRTVINANGTGIDEFSTGDRGPEMKKIQERLKALGFYTYENITDFYGPLTEEAILAFKKANGLDANSSVIDTRTYTTLFSSSAVTAAQYNATQQQQQATTTQQTTTTTATTAKKTTTTQKKTNSSSSNVSGPVNGAGVEAMISAAQAKLGSPYSFGASGPNTFDCSGFVMYAAQKGGKSLPRTSYTQANAGRRVSYAQLQRGDIVCFYSYGSSGGSIEHVGIYLGGGSFIHAASGSAMKVTTSSLSSGSYRSRFSHGVRIF